MPMLFYSKESDVRAVVTMIHYKPEILPFDQREQGIIVDEIPPKPALQIGKAPILYINPQDNSLWWEYHDRPLTERERLDDIELLLAELIGK